MLKKKFQFKRALVVVAHPDDETIWMGGTIFKNPRLNWTIFSLSRASDKDRAPKFRRVCQIYRAKPVIADLDDEGQYSFGHNLSQAKMLLRRHIENKRLEAVFTHGANGEYGHPLHKIVNQAVNDLIKQKVLQPKVIFYFNYKKRSKYKLAARNNSDILFKLNKIELEKKKRIVANFYGYDYKGIDVGYCTNPEAFKIINF